MKKKVLKSPCEELDIPGVGKAIKHPGCEEEVVGLLDYSLDEQDTGRKWLDGRAIFCKTLQFTYPTGPFLEIPHLVPDMDQIVGKGFEGVIRRRVDLNHQWCSIGTTTHPLSGNSGEQILVTVNRSVVRFDDNSTQWDNEPGFITIYYVKLP